MPRAIEPGIKFEIVCESDKDKPAENRPTFIYRALNGREWKQVAEIADMSADKFGEETVSNVYRACSVGLVGWRNMIDPGSGCEIPFEIESLDLVIDPIEAMNDLLLKVMEAAQPTVAEKKS